MRIVVLGGSGFLGRRAVDALRTLGGAEVLVASRRGPVRLDLADSSTFSAVLGADLVLDLADTTRARPEGLARYCLEEGIVFLEGSSDPEAMRRLRDVGREVASPKGAIVLGAGIFTGVSNLLARAVSRAVGTVETLRLGISSSPYSGAGSGTVALMVALLERPAIRWAEGARIEALLSRGPTLRFATGARPTLLCSMAESEMIGPSTGARSADVYFAPRPSLLVAAFLSLPPAMLRARWFGVLLTGYFTLVRRALLGWLASTTELVAEATGERTARRTVHTTDGMAAGAAAAAAIALELLARPERPRGVVFVDDVLDLEPVVARANEALAPGRRLSLG